MTVYVTSIGSPNEREIKRYKTVAGAKQHARSRLTAFADWCEHYNRALKIEVQEASKAVDEMALLTLPPNQPRKWEMTDDYTGVTFVVEVWTEKS